MPQTLGSCSSRAPKFIKFGGVGSGGGRLARVPVVDVAGGFGSVGVAFSMNL